MPEGNVGEIWIRSKSRALGFWAQPGKTAEDFEARLADNSQVRAAETAGKHRTLAWKGMMPSVGVLEIAEIHEAGGVSAS